MIVMKLRLSRFGNRNSGFWYFSRKPIQGAVTVEYAIIFPMVIICVIILIHMGLLYYQQALLQSVTAENAQNWAFLWGYDAEKIQPPEGVIHRKVYQSEGMYWQIFSGASRKKEIIRFAIEEEIYQKSILKPIDGVAVEVRYHNYLIIQKVGIKVTANYSWPVKGLLQSIGVSGDVRMEAYSETMIHDPKEFIHNVDYLLQIYEETGARDWVQEKCKPLVDSLQRVKAFFQ